MQGLKGRNGEEMLAAVTYGKEDIRIEERPVPSPQAGEVLIRVKNAGICGGDVRIYKGLFPYSNFPLINGHELSGEIAELGSGAEGDGTLRVGDRVVLDPIRPCGRCYACRSGKPNCCHELKVTGVHVDGAFAEYMTAPRERVHRIPDCISWETGSLIEPYAIAEHAANLVNVEAGELVLILGAGPIGVALVDVCKSRGAEVVLSEVQEKRLAFAERFGADRLVNSAKEDLNAIILGMTEGYGAPVVMEATGVPAVMAGTEDLVANGGRIGLVGVTGGDVTFHGLNFSKKELNIFGSRNSRNVFPGLIDKVARGLLHPEKMATHHFPLQETKEALHLAAYSPQDVCKVVLDIG